MLFRSKVCQLSKMQTFASKNPKRSALATASTSVSQAPLLLAAERGVSSQALE